MGILRGINNALGGVAKGLMAGKAAAQAPKPMDEVPRPPAAPPKNIGEPFKGGDRVLDRREITSSTNWIPGVKHEGEARHYSRGISLREDRDQFMRPKDYQRMTKGMISAPPEMPPLPKPVMKKPPKKGVTYKGLMTGKDR